MSISGDNLHYNSPYVKLVVWSDAQIFYSDEALDIVDDTSWVPSGARYVS